VSEAETGRVALVTGASRGLGAAVGLALAVAGVRTVLTARTVGGLEEVDDAIRAAGGQATLLPMDLTEGDEVDRIGPSLFQRFGRLDILVHCAATLGTLTPAEHILPKDWESTIALNQTATWRLIRSCGPLLRHAQAGRAVFITDRCAALPTSYWGTYGATKAAAANLVLSWAGELGTTNARVNLFDPGPMATKLRRAAFPGEDQTALPHPSCIAPDIVALCDPAETRHGQIITVRG